MPQHHVSSRNVLRRSGYAALALGLMLALQGCGGTSAASDDTKASESRLLDSADGKDWAAPGRTFGEQHFSPLTEINDGNVGELGLAWSLDLPAGYTVTQPIAVDGVLYFMTGLNILRAVDALTGKELWNYDPETWKGEPNKMRTAWGGRGVAWWNGKIYFGTLDGRLIAVDAASGKPVWSVQTTQPNDGRFITGAPRVFDGKVIIGHGGADSAAVRGYVTAYDAQTGKQAWRFYTVPGNPADGFENDAMKMAAKTWAGEWWKQGGGGTVWNAMSYDPETQTVFLGTGNGAPWNRKVRSAGQGDNLFLCSIVALDAKTGAYKWHFQINPGESWDYNAAMDMQFADLTINGQPRKVLMTAPKNGFLYVLDRNTGAFISGKPFARVTWTTGLDPKTGRPIDVPNNRFENGPFTMAPGPVGAHSWLPMAFNPQTKLVYIPTIEMEATLSDTFKKPSEWHRPPFHATNAATGIDMPASKGGSESSLVAWDPIAQKEVWRIPTPTNVSGGVMTTAGNLVFQGTVDNRFSAYNAKSGKRLWSFDTKAPTIAPPITYSIKGRQYVTVISGGGGSLMLKGDSFQKYPIGYREQARRVLTFAIGGKAVLPAAAPYRFTPAADPEYKPDPAAEQRGFAIYSQTCIMCHGRDGIVAGGAPDLRASPVIADAETFRQIVREGALQQNGMPRFEDLSDAMREDIRQYLRKLAADARKAQK